MRLRFGVLSILLLAIAFAWACSLNPQPLPPETVDAAFGGADAKSASGDAATLSPEGGSDLDAEPSPGDDASDATEEPSDADASDATESDAREDADDAGFDE